MTFDDVIRVANQRRETRCDSGYKYPCAPCSVSWAVGLPSLTPKPVVGLPNWNRPNIQQWVYQAGLIQLDILNGLDYLKRFMVSWLWCY